MAVQTKTYTIPDSDGIVSLSPGEQKGIELSGFDFDNVTPAATIYGFELRIYHNNGDLPDVDVRDVKVALVTFTEGDNRAKNQPIPGHYDAYEDYGSPTDLWGFYSVDPSHLNSLAVVIEYKNFASVAVNVSVRNLTTLTIYYDGEYIDLEWSEGLSASDSFSIPETGSFTETWQEGCLLVEAYPAALRTPHSFQEIVLLADAIAVHYAYQRTWAATPLCHDAFQADHTQAPSLLQEGMQGSDAAAVQRQLQLLVIDVPFAQDVFAASLPSLFATLEEGTRHNDTWQDRVTPDNPTQDASTHSDAFSDFPVPTSTFTDNSKNSDLFSAQVPHEPVFQEDTLATEILASLRRTTSPPGIEGSRTGDTWTVASRQIPPFPAFLCEASDSYESTFLRYHLWGDGVRASSQWVVQSTSFPEVFDGGIAQDFVDAFPRIGQQVGEVVAAGEDWIGNQTEAVDGESQDALAGESWEGLTVSDCGLAEGSLAEEGLDPGLHLSGDYPAQGVLLVEVWTGSLALAWDAGESILAGEGWEGLRSSFAVLGERAKMEDRWLSARQQVPDIRQVSLSWFVRR